MGAVATKDGIAEFFMEKQIETEMDRAKIFFRPTALADLVNKTMFTKQELCSLYRNFKECCPNGIVTLTKFQEIMGHIYYIGNSKKYVRMVFETFDKDNSGEINFEEYVCGLSTLSRGTDVQKLTWIYSLYDRGDKGGIVKEDLVQIIKSMYLMMNGLKPVPNIEYITQHADLIFKKLDENSDGVITLPEFLIRCLNDDTICYSLEQYRS